MSNLEHAIVISGGIATGKSAVVSIVRNHGFECIDADKIAHQILNENALTIAQQWGQEYIHDDGTVNRQKFGQMIFRNAEQKNILERILHPLIRQEIYHQAGLLEQKKCMYFIDIPLFFENSSSYRIPTSVLIYAPREMQKQRLMKRNQLSEQQAEDRLASQMDIEEKKKLATFMIDNSGSKAQLANNCQNFINNLER